MKNILDAIVANKKIEVEKLLKHIEKKQISKTKGDYRIPVNFLQALKKPGLSMISEVKKASPSKGVIREDFDPIAIAESYVKHQASCLSVLTETKYFQGHPDFLRRIRKITKIPILRKDFIVDERQIRESYDLGADAILLIVAILEDKQLKTYQQRASEFGLTCLVEIHTEKELDLALQCESKLIGVNNRNLTTFETKIEHSLQLKKKIPQTITTISESGIYTANDCLLLYRHGFDAILVGESLMREAEPGKGIDELLSKIP